MIFLLYTGTSALISNIQGTKKYSAVMYYIMEKLSKQIFEIFEKAAQKRLEELHNKDIRKSCTKKVFEELDKI